MQKKSPLGAWIFLVVLVVGTAVGGFFFRHDIVKAYRPANAIFSAIGFPVDTLGFGLSIGQPQTRAVIGEDKRVLEVTGEITNTGAEAIQVPILRGALRNAQGLEVHVWSFRTEEPRILPGETVRYETAVESPPSGATGLYVSFARAEELVEEGIDLPEGVEAPAGMPEGGGEEGGMMEELEHGAPSPGRNPG